MITNVLLEQLRKYKKHSYRPIVVLVVPVSLSLINGSQFTDSPLCGEGLFVDTEID